MEIITLLKANIRYRKGSFISVLVLSFIISICLSSILSVNYNIAKRADESLKLNVTGDLISIIMDFNCPDSMLEKVKADKDIDHINVVKTLSQELVINKKKKGSSTLFTPYLQNKQSYMIYNSDSLSFQKNPQKLMRGEIYVPISFERLYDCHIGDTAYLTVEDSKRSFTIKGYFEEPFLGCELIGSKLALMNEADFNELYSERIGSLKEREESPNKIVGYYLIHMFRDKDCNKTASELKKSVNKESGLIDYSVFTVSKEQTKSVTLMFAQIISGILLIFLILLFVVILIVVGHSISTGIEMDYTNLGVLKAIGYSKNKLRQVFVLEYVLAEVIGILLGLVASIPAVYYLNSIFVKMSGLLSDASLAFGICLIILAAIILLSTLFIYMKTKAIMKISPVSAIAGGRSSVYFHSRVELPVDGKGLYFKLALRQLTSNLKQYISITVIVAILVYFLITITLLGTGIDKKTVEESFGAYVSDLQISYNPHNEAKSEEVKDLQVQVEQDIKSKCAIEKSFQLGNLYFTVNGDEYHSTIYEDPKLMTSILKGRAPKYDNEIAITEIVEDELGVTIGDTVKLGYKDKESEYLISGIFQSMNDLGRTIGITMEGTRKLAPDYRLNDVNYKLTDSDKSAEVAKMLTKKYGERIDVVDENAENEFGDTLMATMGILNVIIYSISVIFSFTIILITCGKIFIKEKMDYGIYKAFGFTASALRLQFALRFAIVALCGSLFGIALNLGLNNMMMSTLLRNVGITSFSSNYNVISLLLPPLLLTTCFFLFAYLVSGKIKSVDTKNLICDN